MVASSFAALLLPSAANAIILDEDDEDMVRKAKDNRSNKIKKEKMTEAKYSKLAGLNKDDTAAVQRAVNRLAKTGNDLDSGKVSDAASTISDKWVAQFQKAASNISGNDTGTKVVQAISSLEASAKGGNLQDAKQKYVTAVTALQSWVGSSGISGIKGL